MIKLFFTSVVFFCLFYQVKAQSKGGLWISPKFSIGGATATGVSPPKYKPEISATFSVGADAAWMFNNRLGVGSGLQYSAIGIQWAATDKDYKEQYKTGQGGLEIPLFIRYVISENRNFIIHGGFINSFFLLAEETTEVNGKEVSNISGSEANRHFSKYSIMPFLYLGGNIPLSEKVQATLGPQVSYQINNNFSDVSGMKGHYWLFALKIGVGFQAIYN